MTIERGIFPLSLYPGIEMAIVGPIAPYSNVPINADYYSPSRFVITDITRGPVTVVTTSVAHNYVIGQQIRLIIPLLYGCRQLNEAIGFVIAIPSTTQVTVDIDSTLSNPFQTPLASITGASKAVNCILTASNHFGPGARVLISDVGGMTQLNGNTYIIVSSNGSTMTLNVDSTSFTTYTSGGTASLVTTDTTVPQILAVGDINSGIISSTGIVIPTTNIPGSFVNIS